MRRVRWLVSVICVLAACSSFDGGETGDPSAIADGGVGSDGRTDPVDGNAVADGAPADASTDAGDSSDASDASDAGATDFPAAVRGLRGLVAYWRLDDVPKTTAVDVIGGNEGKYVGTTVGIAPGLLPGEGDAGASYFGDQAVSAVRVTGGGKEHRLATFGTALTVGALVRMDLLNTRIIVSKDNGFAIGVLNSGSPVVFLDVLRGGVDDARMTSNVIVDVGKPALIIGTFDAVTGEQVLWVNGKPTTVQGRTHVSTASDSTLCIGAYTDNCDNVGWSGPIDEVFLANAAASAADVALLTRLAGF